MALKEALEKCIQRGRWMTKQIATSEFGNDLPESRSITRRFGIMEAAKLIGVSPTTIRNEEKAGKLPAPDTIVAGSVKRREGYTIYQIDQMREILGLYPIRPEGSYPVTVGYTVNKGGAYKTSASIHCAQKWAMLGYRVLFIDMDPQATGSLTLGYVPDVHTSGDDTVLPFLLGEQPDLKYAIKKTSWPRLDLVPSCLELHLIESEMNKRYDAGELGDIPIHLRLRAGIESIDSDYDIFVIDGAPNLGVGTINVVCAADSIVVPTPAELYDYVSANQFFTMLHSVLSDIDMGGFEPEIKVLVTKFSNSVGSQSPYMTKQIMAAWQDMVLDNVVRVTDQVGKGQIRMRTVFEQASEQRSSGWQSAVTMWEAVADEIFQKLIQVHWESK